MNSTVPPSVNVVTILFSVMGHKVSYPTFEKSPHVTALEKLVPKWTSSVAGLNGLGAVIMRLLQSTSTVIVRGVLAATFVPVLSNVISTSNLATTV